MPHTGAPTASNPTTTPGANRPTAPSTPATAGGPTVQPQRRPDHDGPTFTPRPAADRGPATNRPDPRNTYANPRPDIPSRLDPTGSNNGRPDAARPDTTRPDLGSRLDPTGSNTARPDTKRPDTTRPDLGSRLDPTGSNNGRPDAARPDATRPDVGSRLDPTGSNNTRPDTPQPDSAKPDIPSRLDPTDSNDSRPDAARPDDTQPDIGSRLDPTGQDADRPTDHTPDSTRPPLSESRPYDTPGGLERTDPQHQQDLESRVPRNPDGTPQRHPDPNGDWPGAVNGDGHRAPGRDNNCLDVALSTADTYSGNPTAAAPRNDTGPDGEQGGRDRAERQLGAPFRDMGDGDQAFKRIEDQLRDSGHGSQAVIVTQDANGRAHAWNVVNHDGKITYLDNQTGQRSDKPLHNGDNGVFAVALDPDRRPIPADGNSPDRPGDGTERRPEDPAGKHKPDPEDGSDAEPDEHPNKKKKPNDSDSEHDGQSQNDPDHPLNDPARTEHDRLPPAEQTDNLIYGVAGDEVQKHLRETNDVHRVDMEHVHQQLKDWANSGHLGDVLDRTTGDDRQTFRRSDLEHALPGFKDMTPGEQGAAVAAMGRMSDSFHEMHGAGMSPEQRDYPYSADPNNPGSAKGQDEQDSRGHVDHEKTKTDAGLKQSPDAAKIKQDIKDAFGAKSFEAALDQAVHRPDLTGKNYAVMEVYDPKTKEISYIVESSVPPSSERAGIPRCTRRPIWGPGTTT
ncbi:toxin glutamine deamidase domain-containing protein [Kitasatospora gansuensis]